MSSLGYAKKLFFFSENKFAYPFRGIIFALIKINCYA